MITAHCYAKINLYLNVSSKREDGFHNIESVFQNISLFDTLLIRKSDEYSLSYASQSADFVDRAGDTQDNLITKVYEYFVEQYGVTPVSIELDKQIPIGAGLGGGSSDCAGALLAFNRIFNLKLPLEKLAEIGAIFGSDVPFFIYGGLAKVAGRGEKIEPIKASTRRIYYILVYPDLHISTREAYQENVEKIPDNGRFHTFLKEMQGFLYFEHELNLLGKQVYNGFQKKTLERYRVLNMIHEQLSEQASFSFMSGSGSSMLGAYEYETYAQKIYSKMVKQHKYLYLLNSIDRGVVLT